jgi:acetylornithine deacetylase
MLSVGPEVDNGNVGGLSASNQRSSRRRFPAMNDLPLSKIRLAVQAVQRETEQFLCDLIRLPSLPGEEQLAVECAAQRFAEVGQVERMPLSDTLREDVDYADPLPGLVYAGRSNLRVRVAGSGGGRSLLFNTHLDVVPPSQGQEHPFEPKVEAGRVHGRGACDAKGQIAALFAALLALKHLGMTLRGDVLAHLVVEEEVGGNGTLALVRRGEQADACIVMEPSDLRIFSSVRGSVWFRVTCTGRAGHAGHLGDTVSALKMAIRTVEILEQYQARLFASSQGIPLFARSANPMPILFGKLTAGDWLGTVPASASLEGLLGFLPNKTRYQVMDEIRQALKEEADEWLRDHFTLKFPNRHDAHVLDPGHPLVTRLQACCQEAGATGEVSAMTASCDSWLYNNQLHIPTVVFGPGSLRYAHTNEEQISWDEICEAVTILIRFLADWCG